MLLRAIAAAWVMCACAGGVSAEAARVALVIGNSNYRNVSPLANPQNDARLVANALAASGFTVQLGLDLDRKGMETALKEFAHDAMQADVAMVYFAGHGMESRGANWLIPVDARIQSFDDVPEAAIPFDLVARSLAGAAVKIVALDACRNNPFTARLPAPSGAINRGLAEVELDGYVVIYAAAAGQVALDGDVNSPFARTLARWLGEPDLDLRLLAGKIRDDVIAATAGAQRPFVSASLPGKVTTLAPAPAGSIREAAKTPLRRPYYFDYVRALRAADCTPTTKAKCRTDNMLAAGGFVVTVDDDAKVRIWNETGQAIVSAVSVPSNPVWPLDVTFLEPTSQFVITHHRDIITVPASGAGQPETHSLEHHDSPEFLAATATPPLVVYTYRMRCTLAFVDLASHTLAGITAWSDACMKANVEWMLPDTDPASERFALRVATMRMRAPVRVEELLVASYRTREVLCRVEGAILTAVFGADGDLYTAYEDGTVTRHGRDCQAKRTFQLHQGAIQEIIALEDGRMISRSIDGAVKLWSPETMRAERELSGLPREARLLDAAKDGSAVLILNEDKRLHLWYGEARLGPYIGPAEPVCMGALSPDTDAVYALKCEGHVELWRRQRPDG